MKRISEDFLVVSCDGPGDAYCGTLRGIQQNGSIVVSRGLETKEIRPAMFIFNNPRERFLTCPGRNIHPFFQVLESIWILGGRGDVKWISYYLKNMEKYSDGQKEFHAPYGVRMRKYGYYRSIRSGGSTSSLSSTDFIDQFEHCYRYLSENPDTRHAVMTFWHPSFDNYKIETIDRPCNVSFFFLIRDGKLDLTISNRSNDVNLGFFNANVVQFSVILETMAMLLGVPVGKQIHMINSLHYYTNDPITEEVLSRNKEETEFNMYKYVRPHPFGLRNESGVDTWSLFNECIEDFFDDEKAIWEGKLDNNLLHNDFSFLRDGLYAARSFYFYKKIGDYGRSVRDLCEVKADDFFITAAEFFARKIDFEIMREAVVNRFQKRLSERSLIKILEYIQEH